MLEQKINQAFGDNDPTGFGTGRWLACTFRSY
jgi:hypothetical protein